jgi:hypothetical protein
LKIEDEILVKWAKWVKVFFVFIFFISWEVKVEMEREALRMREGKNKKLKQIKYVF